MTFRLGLCGLAAAVVAACSLYLIKDRVSRLEAELGRHRAQVAAEELRLHRLRAEWAMLSEPGRLGRLAAEHLDLGPGQPTRMMTVADLPRRADLELEAWRRRAVLPSGAEVDLLLKPPPISSSFDTLAKGLQREP
jgi:hypothetical protein